MAYDAEISVRQGSARPLYANVAAQVGATLTIQAGATFTLFDSTGAVVAGFNAVPVAGFDAATAAAARAWYVLATAALAPGTYLALFSVPVQGSDNIARTIDVEIEVHVLAKVEIRASYDDTQLTSSLLYQARFHTGDVDTGNANFSDAELNWLLTKYQSTPELAAAAALDALATDKARLANAVRIGTYGNGEASVYSALVERAAKLRQVAPVYISVAAPCPVFVSATADDPGTMDW